MGKTVRVGDRIGQDDAMSPFVERFGDVSEPLLSRSIPDVERYLASIKFNPLDLKVHTNRTQIIRLEIILTVSNQQTRLSNPTIAHNEVLQCDIL